MKKFFTLMFAVVLGAGMVGCDSKAASNAKKANKDEANAEKKAIDADRKVDDAMVDKTEAIKEKENALDAKQDSPLPVEKTPADPLETK